MDALPSLAVTIASATEPSHLQPIAWKSFTDHFSDVFQDHRGHLRQFPKTCQHRSVSNTTPQP